MKERGRKPTESLEELWLRRKRNEEVQKLLGHSSSRVTEVYSHLQPEHLHSTVDRIDYPSTEKVRCGSFPSERDYLSCDV